MSDLLKQYIKQGSPFEDREQVAILNLLVAASFLRQKIEQACGEMKITQGHYNILRILRGAPIDGYARSEIISRLIDKGADVTRLIDRLVKISLVSRVKSKADRRVVLHTITDDGLKFLENINPKIMEVKQMLGQRLDPDEIETLIGLCEKIYREP